MRVRPPRVYRGPPPYSNGPPSRAGVYAKRGLAALVASLIVLNCSGLHFPIINPRGDLDGRLRRDLGVPLPPSAVIDQSYRVAYRDPERVYSLHMSPPAVAP